MTTFQEVVLALLHTLCSTIGVVILYPPYPLCLCFSLSHFVFLAIRWGDMYPLSPRKTTVEWCRCGYTVGYLSIIFICLISVFSAAKKARVVSTCVCVGLLIVPNFNYWLIEWLIDWSIYLLNWIQWPEYIVSALSRLMVKRYYYNEKTRSHASYIL